VRDQVLCGRKRGADSFEDVFNACALGVQEDDATEAELVTYGLDDVCRRARTRGEPGKCEAFWNIRDMGEGQGEPIRKVDEAKPRGLQMSTSCVLAVRVVTEDVGEGEMRR
jgi:hypothetical protein